MEQVFQTVVAVISLTIGVVCPFVAVFRGAELAKIGRRCWIALITFYIVVCIIVPDIGNYINLELGKTLITWVPEERAVVAIVFGGWAPPLISGGLGLLARRFCLAQYPEFMSQISFHA